MAAIVGAAGLASTLAAVRAGKRVLLANKEAMVMAGPLVTAAARASGAQILPVDSEHNAIFQCFSERKFVSRIVLTASGGPFRATPAESLGAVTPDQACAHPNWVMGRKISVDSATMMNKGLEVIEARWLFDVAPERIEVLIHPQSIVHSLVEYADGSMIAQLSNPDMRVPIAHALAYPERIYLRRAAARPRIHPASFLRKAGSGTLSLFVTRLYGAAYRRHGTRGTERRQRNRGRGVPRRTAAVHRHSGGHRRHARLGAGAGGG